ncbi:stage II sporulation protein M [Aeribacillus alveayuensis]|uniref:Membrane protein SpoIIM required for sporulation n=1 Tax=Aeribacillus alveayuensis TaxID=279215 RepID=A0ABT9VSN9_9BACI|nr:putative membrane protein SpoIIM required for sporulation [Bacillus alveayuensis]
MKGLNKLRNIFNKGILSIYLIQLIFILTIYIILFFFPPEVTKISSKELIKYIDWFSIFINNISTAFTIIFIGILTFGFFSTITYLFGLYMLILAIYTAFQNSGSLLYSFSVIMVHGILELIGIALAYYISTISFRVLINKIYKKQIFHVEGFNKMVQLFLAMIVIFFISSLLESHMTPNILKIIVRSL